MKDRKNRATIHNPLDPNRSQQAPISHGSVCSGKLYKQAILAACDRHEKQQEHNAQHGPVRILFKDGKPV